MSGGKTAACEERITLTGKRGGLVELVGLIGLVERADLSDRAGLSD